MESFTRFEARFAAAGDDSARVVVLNRFAAEVAPTGDFELALSLAARAEALAQPLGYVRELGRSGYVRANCEYLRAEYVSAHKHSLESCTVAENCGDREGLAAALLLAAACQYQMGALEESNTALLQVLDIVTETPDEEHTFRAHNMLGMILSNRDDHEAAERHFELAIAAGMRMGSEFYLQRARVNRASNFRKIGVALRGAGRRAEALTRFRAAAAVCEAIRASGQGAASRENAAGCAGVLGEIYLELERTDEALALFDEMLQHGTAMGNLLFAGGVATAYGPTPRRMSPRRGRARLPCARIGPGNTCKCTPAGRRRERSALALV